MSSKKEARGRIAWLDLGKGFAMALVLLGHSMRDGMRVSSPALDLVYRVVYIFHMTYFFWMSGFTYSLSRGKGQPPLRAAGRRIKKQLAPWLGYTLFIYAVFFLAGRVPSVSGMLKEAGYGQMPLGAYLLSAVQANNPWAYHLWFLLVLMLITLIVALCDAAAGGKRLRLVCWGLIAAGLAGLAARGLVPLGEWYRLFDYLALYLPMFCLGVLMAGWKPSRAACWLWGGAGIVYITVRAVCFSDFSGNSLRTDSALVRFILYLLADLLLPGVMLLLQRLFEEGAVPRTAAARRFLTFLGRESMLIYLVHQPFCCAFLGLVLYNKLGLPSLIVMAACLAASIAVPWAIGRVRNAALAKWKTR